MKGYLVKNRALAADDVRNMDERTGMDPCRSFFNILVCVCWCSSTGGVTTIADSDS